MAYGQTGSGKSFTALGPHSKGEPVPQPEALGDSGVIPRAAGELFRYRRACGGLVTLVAGSAAPGEAATAAPADFSSSHLLTTVPLPQPLPPRHRRAAVCPRTGLAPKEARAGSAAEGALAIRARNRPAVKSVTATELLCPVPQLPATGRRPSMSCRTASVSPRTQGLRRGSLGPATHAEQVRAKLRPVDLVGSECAGESGKPSPAWPGDEGS
ncbi:hypothetical protein J1605_020613 [Eschrichtius robustus]|uniref:Kinesin motor domain-containing protein n=1 Tax=Eschrichtius robustus TaxID=9764 RepID=A0AB34HJ88_ESCRO|nr:hypothetical protein J1605_020613 [Eschrichtius robustus]